MPKKIDPAVRVRVLRMVADHRGEYATPMALAKVLAARERIGVETVRRWIVAAEIEPVIDPAFRLRVGGDQAVDGEVAPAGGRQRDFEGRDGFLRRVRADGHAVESVRRVLPEQGCRVAARTYRAWRSRPPAARARSATLRSSTPSLPPPGPSTTRSAAASRRRGCMGGKMTAHLRRTVLPRSAGMQWTGRCGCSGCPGCAATRGFGPRSGQGRETG